MYHLDQKRKINDAIDAAIMVDENNFRQIIVNSILPKDDKMYQCNGQLSQKGFEEFWLYLDDQVKQISGGDDNFHTGQRTFNWNRLSSYHNTGSKKYWQDSFKKGRFN